MEPFNIIDELNVFRDDNGIFPVPTMYLAYYIPPRRLSDPISVSIEKFKHNQDKEVVQTWIDIATECISAKGIKADCIVRALGHNELTASDTKSLDLLGKALEKVTNAEYHPDLLLKKSANKPLHGTKSLVERGKELKDNYYWNTDYVVDDDCSFIIIDDITTSGTTLEHIARTIRKNVKGAKISAFVIGRTNHQIGINNKFDLSPFNKKTK